MAMSSTVRAPAAYVTHGGGPMPILGGFGQEKLAAWLKTYGASLATPPKALLVVSGHWEERVPTVQAHPHPPMLYDYYGFPPAAYELKYPAPGNPELADRVCSLLKEAGMECKKDAARGFDHGTFVPLMLMFPQADIPVVQLSLMDSLDPKEHIRMGEALAPLRDQGVAVIGSGASWHNLGAMRAGDESMQARSKDFDDWLHHVCADPSLSYEQRVELLCAWSKAPEARYAHPREEHLLPLHVALGASKGDSGKVVFSDIVMGVHGSSVQFG